MMTRHYSIWSKEIPKSLDIMQTPVHDNLRVSAARYPDKTAIIFYEHKITYRELMEEVNYLTGYLQKELNVNKGDRVLLYMQNSPQYIISFYAIMQADAIVVPINPMSVKNEVEYYIKDATPKIAIVGQELMRHIMPLIETTDLQHIIVSAYSEYAGSDIDYDAPDIVLQEKLTFDGSAIIDFKSAINKQIQPDESTVKTDDLCCLPYTSGTTGIPKGSMHTHRTLQANVLSGSVWRASSPGSISLASLPLFHVTGLTNSMNVPIYSGGTIVLTNRWDATTAAILIERYKCSHWVIIAAMLIDFMSNPKLSNYDISSIVSVSGGGAALPEAVGEKLMKLTGVKLLEGYGLTETIAQTHSVPEHHHKLQSLGIPLFDVDARVINPDTLEELGPKEQGEIVVNGPQVFKGYWEREEDTKEAFIDIDGKQFFRTGDIAYYDEEGFFFMVDRVKRMINASGFKVWPTEIENTLYKHPAVQQAVVVGTPDPKRGETVKAFIILNHDSVGKVSEQEIIDWSKEQMAAYKYPRLVEFRETFPMTGSGKILWRKLQEEERAKQPN